MRYTAETANHQSIFAYNQKFSVTPNYQHIVTPNRQHIIKSLDHALVRHRS